MGWKREPLEDYEADQLIQAAADISSSHHLVVLALLRTGMRADELAHLHSSWVTFDRAEASISVKPMDGWTPKSEAGIRMIPIRDPDLIRMLRQHFSHKEDLGISRTTIWRRVTEAADHAGLQKRTSPHVLRHTYGTDLAAKGASAQYLKQTMGHSDLATSQQYITFSGRRLHQEADHLLS